VVVTRPRELRTVREGRRREEGGGRREKEGEGREKEEPSYVPPGNAIEGIVDGYCRVVVTRPRELRTVREGEGEKGG
jgi:hypothetical protein